MPASVRHSKLLSLVLRHAPEKASLTLGPGGWVGVEDLLAGLRGMGTKLDRGQLVEIVERCDKQRFTLSEDGRRIRAAQGHSKKIEIDLARAAPPERLFHGTATRSLDAILKEGLKPMSRLHVHLSGDRETARKVGARHGRPVILTVLSGEMAGAGRDFFCADNGVWLTAEVPCRFLVLEGSDA